MKRIAFIIAIMASMLFAACGENTKIDIKYDHPERYNIGDVTMSQPISSISVDWVCGNVDIRYTDDTAVRIYEEIQEGFLPLTDSLRMRYYVDEEGELEIRFCGPYKYRYGDIKNLRKHLNIEVPRGTELKDIDIDGLETGVVIENVVSRELTVDGVKINVNADYPDALPDEIDIDGVQCLLALHVVPETAGLTIEMPGIKPFLSCDLPSRKEGEKTIVGDGRCKVKSDGVDVHLSIRELK
ncbi:MAG: hypothetical protein K6F72_01460 [Bacteroidales bacterium]|nr:hypothetical protein [Bacteroidales bacterium]